MSRTPCHGCGKLTYKLPRAGKRRYPHKCPHGKWCACGHPLAGVHANQNEFCLLCREASSRKEPPAITSKDGK